MIWVLTVQLKKLAEVVIGVDSSESMIKRVQQQYPDIKFIVSDARALPFEEQFDVVFSNAVFHWITDHNALLNNIHKSIETRRMPVYMWEMVEAMNLRRHKGLECKLYKPFGILRKE